MPFFTNDGHRLHYREAGNGPLLLVLPGNTASSACHEGELLHFSTRYHVVAMDLWGTGRSDREAVWPDDWWERGAHDAAALIAWLGYTQAIVMGTSGGAIVSLFVAILHPAQVRGVIGDSTVEQFPPPTLTKSIQDRRRCTEEQVAFWSHEHGDDWQQVVEADSDFLLRYERTGGDVFHGRLKEIRCPVLLSGSLKDASLPDVEIQLRAMVRQLKSCRLFMAMEGSHPLMWSRPEEFRREADKFLSRVDAMQ
jgi:valacyclovir hydrolase